MPKTTEALYSAAETALMLRLKLGPNREWSNTLADMRRNKTTIRGYKLLPFNQARPDGNLRPFYRLRSINAFIAAIKALSLDKPPAIVGRVFEFDEPSRTTPNDWKTRILVPIARSRYRFQVSANESFLLYAQSHVSRNC